MKQLSALKYMHVLVVPLLAFISFHSKGIYTFLPMIEAFLIVPILELAFKPDESNLSEAEEKLRKQNPIYDWQVYLMVPVQLFMLFLFLNVMKEPELALVDKIGRITAMGLMCGVIGINVAHELGHRNTWYEQLMAKTLLMTSLYMHFFIEHNKGHHKNVSTKEDPSSARFGEPLYAFWVRSVFGTYFSAWKLEIEKLKKSGKPFFSISNEMLRFQIIQVSLVVGIYIVFGASVMGYFLIAAVMGFLLLETVNYIEHYGLEREKKANGYERVMPHHSWNSNHIMGRLLLFELSRHSDHHFIASRKYQILRHMDHSAQMPTGYPGMMLISTIPPIWFRIMNPRIKEIKANN